MHSLIFNFNKLTQNKIMLYLFLFLIVFSYFLWLNTSPTFADPDSFYHAKIIELIKDNGIVKNFTWLPYTTLNQVYIDHHFLYHLILIPLSLFLNSLMAVKLAAIFFASLAILTFQWLLDKFKIKYSFIYTLILLISHQFIFRINLAKTPSLSLIALLFFIYLIFNYKNKWSWPLFILSFAYIWLHASWPVLLGVTLIYWLINIVFKKNNYKLLINVISGLLAGLVINPYFPTNLKFYWQQTVQIGLVNYKNIIGVGGEWYGFNLVNLIAQDVFIFIALVLGISYFIYYFKKQTTKNWLLLILTLIFFILTLKSRRNVEYFIPVSLIFSALILNQFKAFNQLKKFIQQHKNIGYILLICLIIYIPIVFNINFDSLKNALRQNFHFNQFAGIASWLQDNTSRGDIVWHNKWDDWPLLFYHNHYNKYIVGLDPTFMYLKDKNKYWLWHKISTGEINQNICDTIKEEFQAQFIFVKIDSGVLRSNLELDENCKIIYSDVDGFIYKISKL